MVRYEYGLRQLRLFPLANHVDTVFNQTCLVTIALSFVNLSQLQLELIIFPVQ